MKISKIFLGAALALMTVSASFAQSSKRTRKADEAYKNAEFHKAKELYKLAYSRSGDKNEKKYISFQMAECARLTGNYRQAENYFKRTVKMRYDDPVAILYLAQAQQNLAKYEEAKENYQKYTKIVPNDKRGTEGYEGCVYALDMISNPTRYVVENAKALNSRGLDFSPAWGKKDYTVLFFSTTREGVIGARTSDQTGEYFSDIWATEIEKKRKKRSKSGANKKKEGPKWTAPVSLGEFGSSDKGEETINTKHEEGSVSLNPRANIMYYTQAVYEKKFYDGRRIFVSKRKGGGWEEGQEVVFPYEKEDSTLFLDFAHPAIHPDERTLFFVADLEGGYGGTDIWYSIYDKRKKKWTKPKNVGPEVNTAGNEVFPTVHLDGTLFFASTGHAGLGGYDLYRAEMKNSGRYGNVKNMGYPINSSYDDFGLIFKGNDYKEGFMTSNRKGGKGRDDIYTVKLMGTLFKVNGQLIEQEKNEPMAGVTVKLEGSNGQVIDVTTDKEGNYAFDPEQLEKDVDYDLSFIADGYKSNVQKFTTKGLTIADFERTEDGYLHEISVNGKLIRDRLPVVLPRIEYDFNSADLRESAKGDLDHLVRVLETNPELRIKLRSHTDHIGGVARNNELSQQRAQACVDYLISKGIAAERLEAEGLGKSEPYTMPEDHGRLKKGTVLTPKYVSTLPGYWNKIARQYNRRTDFTELEPLIIKEEKFGEY